LNWLHPLLTSCIVARHLLDFVVQDRGRHTDNPLGHCPIQTVGAPPPSSPIFLLNALFVATLQIFWLSPNMAWDRHRIMLASIPGGLVTRWLLVCNMDRNLHIAVAEFLREQHFVDAVLQAQCSRFGVRCLPKKKMVNVLEKIYYGTHPSTHT